MIALLSLIVGTGLLGITGFLCATLIVGQTHRMLRIATALPLGTLINALLFTLLSVLGIPIALPSFLAGHGLISIVIALIIRLRSRRIGSIPSESIPNSNSNSNSNSNPNPNPNPNPHPRSALTTTLLTLLTLLLILSALALLASFARAAILPTYFWDSFTNWHMRALTMLEAQEILFANVQKPQYPILFHALQMSAMMIGGWHDGVANVVTFLLAGSLLLTIALLASAHRGRSAAFTIPALLLTIPFTMMHMQQGYADIHYVLFILASALALERVWHTQTVDRRMLFLSALLVAGSAWTKLEGLWLGLVPWVAIVVLASISRKNRWKFAMPAVAIAAVLTAPWPILLLFQNLPATSHGIRLAWHLDALPLAVAALFLEGPFGIHWYVTIGLGAVLLFTAGKSITDISSWPSHASILWGLLALAFIAAIFLFTQDSEWLTSQITFSRTMLLPTMLLVQGMGVTAFSYFSLPEKGNPC